MERVDVRASDGSAVGREVVLSVDVGWRDEEDVEGGVNEAAVGLVRQREEGKRRTFAGCTCTVDTCYPSFQELEYQHVQYNIHTTRRSVVFKA